MSTNNFNPTADRSLKRVHYFLPNLGGSWVLFLVVVLFGGIFASVVRFLPQTPFTTSTSLSYFLMMLPVMIWIYIASIKTGNTVPEPLDSPSWGRVYPVLLFLLCAVCVFSLSVLVEPLTAAIPMPEWFKKYYEAMFYKTTVLDTFIAASVFAPLMEEFLCRGIMLRGMLKHTTPTKAIVWSAVIFAVLHLNPWQALPAFVLGLFFGWIYYRTKSLWITIFMHFINNTSSLIASRVFTDVAADSTFKDIMPSGAYYAMLIASAIATILIVYYLKKKLNNGNITKEVISA